MPISKSISIISVLTLHLLLLSHSLFLTTSSALDEDLDNWEELFAIDEEEERRGTVSQGNPSEADVLKRAQKIVLELSNDNAKRVIDDNELVLLLGYAPWDKSSAELMPRFAEAATLLREMGSRVLMAKVDAERYPKAASSLGIKGFPTLLLFVNGSSQRYTGGFKGEEIVIWVQKKTGSPIIRVSSKDSAQEFLNKYHIFVLGLFESFEGPEYEEFLKAAASDNEIQFIETSDVSIAKLLFPDISSESKFLGLVKNDPERFEKYEGTLEEDAILQFVEHNKFPLLTVLTEQNSGRVYASPIKIQVFVFAEEDDFEDPKLLLQEVARKYKTRIMFVYVDSDEENLAKPFLTLFGLEPDEPVVTAFDNTRGGSKHLMESRLTKPNLEEFCSALLQGSLSPYYRSESLPTEKGLIEKVVGRTFDASILESPENILLEVHAPWCMECDATTKMVEKLAKHFKETKTLKFARIDASANEHPKLQITNYPALLFYPAGEKSKPIKLGKKSTYKDMINFINGKLSPSDTGVNKDEL